MTSRLFATALLLLGSQSANAFVSPQPVSQRTSVTNPQLPEFTHTAVVSSPRTKQTSLELAPGFEEAWSSYLSALEADPLLVKSITAGVILGAADLSGQAIQKATSESENDAGVDFARFARFAFFGFILQAPWNHFYYQILDGALPPTEDPFTATTGIKVVIDQFVQAPVFTVIIFAFLGFLEGKTVDQIKQQLDDDYTGAFVCVTREKLLLNSWEYLS